MVNGIMEKLNGGKKTFLTALLGGIIAAIPTAVVVGEYKAKIDTIGVTLDTHLNKFTPDIVAEYHQTKIDVAVHDAQLRLIKESLDEIKRQNADILRAMRKQ